MKFSYAWIKEHVTGLETSPAALSQLITMKTAESEGVEEFGQSLGQICLARVLTSEPIPGSSHNQRATIDAGRHGTHTVVCGASNCRPGVITAYVPVGTNLNGREIGEATIEGVRSEGMLASGADLSISRDHSGILELSGEPGEPAFRLGADAVIEIDNKSLTHRPDLWGHYGMAREVAAITALPLRDPVDMDRLPSGPGVVKVSIEDPALCPRFSALMIENVTVQPSPLWLQARLTAVGLNPISNVVDVTNYVMAELAQPIHAYDADKLRGDTIYVRRAHEGETYAALNDETYTLTPESLVIADEGGAIGLAGVIGGKDSAISPQTVRIVVEAANFNAGNVRKTSSRMRLRTDASMRFEKAQDPVNTTRALALTVALLEQVSPGIRIVGGVTDVYHPAASPAPIDLPLEWLARKLGTTISSEEVRRILTSLEFGVTEPVRGLFRVTVPSWRATKDVTIKDDLVEEVGRMIGYGSIAPIAPLVAARVPFQLPFRLFLRQLRQEVADQGFTEVYNYSFVNEELVQKFGLPAAQHVGVTNPIANDQTLLRSSLLPRIWQNITENSKHFDRFQLFEIGREIHPREQGLPDETPKLVAAVYGKGDGSAGLYGLKRLAECLRPGIEAVPVAARAYEHPHRVAEVRFGDVVLGRLFELHPDLVEHGRAAVLELDLKTLEAHRRVGQYRQIRRVPASFFDLSILAETKALVGDVTAAVRRHGGELLEEVQFLTVYAEPPIPAGQKSISFRLTVAHPTHTLSSDEVTSVRNQIIDGLRADGYTLLV